MYNHMTFSCGGTIQADMNTTSSIYIWANIVTLGGGGCVGVDLNANGQQGGSAPNCCCGVTAGVGAPGGSGGGGGAAIPNGTCGTGMGGSGGNGGSGGVGEAPFCGVNGGSPGVGFGVTDQDGFTYGQGGRGGNGSLPNGCSCGGGPGGTNGDGYGGGGGGGSAGPTGCGSNGLGGGGGGGAGKIVLICNQLLGAGNLQAMGGVGGNPFGVCGCGLGGGYGGPGGGGVIYVAAKKYNGATIESVAAGTTCCSTAGPGGTGTAKIFEINHDGTLGIQKTFNQSWDFT